MRTEHSGDVIVRQFFYQRVLQWNKYFFRGFLAIGGLICVIIGVRGLPFKVTLFGTVFVLTAWWLAEITLRRWSSESGDSDQPVRVVKLRLIVGGAILLLWIPLLFPKPISVAGRVTSGVRPLENACISVTGVSGEWMTNHNGAFQFQVPDTTDSDSLEFVVIYGANGTKSRLDTTVVKSRQITLNVDVAIDSFCTVGGCVKEEGTGYFVAGVVIIIQASGDSGTTNAEGYFRFKVRGKPSQSVKAIIRRPGFELIETNIVLCEKNTIPVPRK